MKNILITLSIVGFLSGCATNAPSAEEKAAVYTKFLTTHKLESLKSIRSFRFHGWNSLDNEHLIITTSPSRAYLITLNGYCIDLKYAQHIGIKRTNDYSLDARFDSILVPGISKSRCFIDTIHEISKDQKNEIIKLVKNNP